MTSERILARNFSSYWRVLLPASDQFVRKINLNYERYNSDHIKSGRPGRRALINEAAFILAKKSFESGIFRNGAGASSVNNFSYSDFIDEASGEAYRKISRFSTIDDIYDYKVEGREFGEIVSISKSILFFISSQETLDQVCFSPSFEGCGRVSACDGDLILGDTLCELKAGERSFRSQDVRQVFIYLCLNYAGKDAHNIKNICFVNPRRGIRFKLSIDDFSLAISGRGFFDIYSDFVNFSLDFDAYL